MDIPKVIRIIFLLLCLSLINNKAIYAHEVPTSLRQVIGSKVVWVSYNVEELKANIPIMFNIRLYEFADGRPVEFDKVKIQFLSGKSVIKEFEFPMSENADATLDMTFPRSGDYTLTVDFTKAEKSFAKSTFPLTVAKGKEFNISELLSTYSIITFIGGFIAYYLFDRRQKIISLLSAKFQKKV